MNSARHDRRAAAFFLVGPTASGKTAVAQWLAGPMGADILSADSMLVYRGMDIGTAKPTPEERRQVRVWGVDLVTPDRPFSVADYLAAVRPVLRAAAAARRPLIVAGGTGLYVQCLLRGLDAAPAADGILRREMDELLRGGGVGALQERVRRDAPVPFAALNESDRANPRRLIRALEIARAGGARAAGWRQTGLAPVAGLRLEPPLLHARIAARAKAMFAGGLPEEIRRLRMEYPALSATARQAIGYAEAFDWLDGRCTVTEAADRTALRTRQLAKRQLTWFRRQLPVTWVDVADAMDVPTVAARVRAVWERTGPHELCCE